MERLLWIGLSLALVSTAGCDRFAHIYVENALATRLSVDIEVTREFQARLISPPRDFSHFQKRASFEILPGDQLELRSNRGGAADIVGDVRRLVIRRGGTTCFDRSEAELRGLFVGDRLERRFAITATACPP